MPVKNSSLIDPSVATDLRKMIDDQNAIAKNFCMTAEHFQDGDDKNVKLCLIGIRSRDGRMHSLPT